MIDEEDTRRRAASGFADLHAAMAWAVGLLDGEWKDHAPNTVEFQHIVVVNDDSETTLDHWNAVVSSTQRRTYDDTVLHVPN